MGKTTDLTCTEALSLIDNAASNLTGEYLSKFCKFEMANYFVYYTKGTQRIVQFHIFHDYENVSSHYHLAIQEKIPACADRNQIFNWIRFKLRSANIPIWNY